MASFPFRISEYWDWKHLDSKIDNVDFSPYILCELGELLCWFDRCSDTQIVHSKHNKRIWFFSTASLSEVHLVLGSFWDLYIPVSCITELSASTCLCVCCVYARRTRWDRQEDTGPPPQKIRKKKRAREREGKKCLSLCSKQAWDHLTTLTHTHIYTLWHLHAVQLSVLEASTVTRWLCRPEE